MHQALAAGGFVFLQGAMLQSSAGVSEQFSAIAAQYSFGPVVILAETMDHYLYGMRFPLLAF
jgi:hypothetical protein